jgi:hypothetical protein
MGMGTILLLACAAMAQTAVRVAPTAAPRARVAPVRLSVSPARTALAPKVAAPGVAMPKPATLKVRRMPKAGEPDVAILPERANVDLAVPLAAQGPTALAERAPDEAGKAGADALFDGRNSDYAPSLIAPQQLTSARAVSIAVSQSLKARHGGVVKGKLEDWAQRLTGGVPAKAAANLAKLETATFKWRKAQLARRVLDSIFDSLKQDPRAQDQAVRKVWNESAGSVAKALESPGKPLGEKEREWFKALTDEVAKKLPAGVKMDAAVFSDRRLFSGMDQWIPGLLWMDPDGQTAHLRVHRTIIEYIHNKDGKGRMKDWAVAGPAEMVAPVAEALVAPLLASKTTTADQARASLYPSDKINKPQLRVLDMAQSAVSLSGLAVRIVRWQTWLGLPALPFYLWWMIKTSATITGSLLVPMAGWAGLALAIPVFAAFAYWGPKAYEAALAKGWVAGSGKNMAYPILMHSSLATLAVLLPNMAFLEEVGFRRIMFEPLMVLGLIEHSFLPAFIGATLLSSAIFAAAHIPNFMPHRVSVKEMIGTMSYFIIAGSILCVVYWGGGFILAGAMHTFYNAWLVWREKYRLKGD